MAREMNGLTLHMRAFRECARHVWNTYFQPLDDGWHEFINVEQALFSALVLEQIHLPEGQWRKDPTGYYPAIKVMFEVPPRGLPVLRAEHVPEMNVHQWEETRLTTLEIDLRFVEFFDFANLDGPRDFRYVKVRVLGAATPGLVGKDLLIEALDVTFEQPKA